MQNGATMQANQFNKRVGGSALGAAVFAMLAACASSPKPAPDAQPPLAASAPMQGPPVPPTPAAQQQAQKTALSAVDELEDGHEDEARSVLQRALALDPGNKLALSLMRQLGTDPVTLLGRESFSYTVKAGESLSKIAGRFLGDIYLFYGLARYNDIKVPKQVGGGQVIRVPGKAPPEESRVKAARAEEVAEGALRGLGLLHDRVKALEEHPLLRPLGGRGRPPDAP